MHASPTSRANHRNAKRPKLPDELAALAQRLGADWKPGDRLMTWIRRHEAVQAELSDLVRDGWSWDDVGRALALAGIMYGTGRPIPGYLLQRKAGKARADERQRQVVLAARRPATAVVKEPGPITSTQAVFSLPPCHPAPLPLAESVEPQTDSMIEKDEAEFRPASLKGWTGTRIVREHRNPVAARSPAPNVDAAEVIARFLGKR